MSELAREAEEIRERPARPRALAAGDVVPNLRADLIVARGAAPGQLELRDPAGDGALVLYDFELQVARMLDGRRRVAELIENAELLGIPVDPEGLSRFLRSLEQQRFLAPPGSAAGRGPGVRPPRRRWDAGTRDRFRAGMRLVRAGRPDEAAPIFQRLLAADPENAEAAEVLALIEAGHALAVRSVGDLFAARPPLAPPRRHRRALAAAALLTAAATLTLVALLAVRLRAPGGGPAVPGPEAEVSPAPGAPAERHHERRPAAPRTAPVERRWHPALGELRAPEAGILSWRDPAPALVRAGERLGELRAAVPPPTPGPSARARLEELERLAATDPVYQEFLEKERASLAAAAEAGPGVALIAPVAGALAAVARTGEAVARGELLARVVDAEAWHVSATVPGETPAPGAACEVAGDRIRDRAAGRVAQAVARDEGHEVTCAVAAAHAPWLERARAPSLLLP